MVKDRSYITLDIQDPTGQIHEATVPTDANVQQFADSLATRLHLPVVAENEEGIHYRLKNMENGSWLPFASLIGECGLVDGSLLQLEGLTSSGSLHAPVANHTKRHTRILSNEPGNSGATITALTFIGLIGLPVLHFISGEMGTFLPFALYIPFLYIYGQQIKNIDSLPSNKKNHR